MAARAWLTLQWKEESWRFVFLLIGCVFLGGSCCGAVSLVEFVTFCQRERGRGPLGGTFTEGATAFVGSARWAGVYKY